MADRSHGQPGEQKRAEWRVVHLPASLHGGGHIRRPADARRALERHILAGRAHPQRQSHRLQLAPWRVLRFSGSCTAVGTYNGGIFGIAERWNGTAWTIERLPSPPGQAVIEQPSVSCTSPTACTAVAATWAGRSPMLGMARAGTSSPPRIL